MSFKTIALSVSLALAAASGFSTFSSAAPLVPAPIASPATGLIETVGYKNRRGYYRVNRIAYYNGHRGYTHRRIGYRYYRGHYFPRRAFNIRVYVGPPVIYKPRHTKPRILRVNNRHVSYCFSKYRSYRASDNTFQPYHGPRKRCRSPHAR